MKLYVNGNAGFDGDGSRKRPFRTIGEAARTAAAGDEVIVAPGIYREYVNPQNAGTENARIVYRSEEPKKAVISGAEVIKGWRRMDGNVWTVRVNNRLFGEYNPYTTFVYGDWYFAGKSKHTGCVYLNGRRLYEAASVQECAGGKASPYSWEPEFSVYRWYAEQDGTDTVLYANFGDADPNRECAEINVRRECFMPQKNGVNYITVSGFTICQAATTWAPPASFQDCMIGPNWAKGWIIEDCDIWGSKCAGIGLGKYRDPENDQYFTNRHVKSPTQMERDAVCRGQYHGWLKENVGSHIIRRNDIHHCEQGGIIGRMGGVFSIIEDNHIHDINNMMELGGAEIAGIKMHAAIDVQIRRNRIHHCTMGIWCDWEAQGTRISQNLLYDNQRPARAGRLPGGMMSQDIFVEVGHGPTLIDNNILLSEVSLRAATEGLALVHNLICGSFTSVGAGTDSIVDGVLRQRFTPYHIPHRTEVMGFMTILHGDNRFFNNIFIQRQPVPENETDARNADGDNLQVGTAVWDSYPTYEEWIPHFELSNPTPDMKKMEPYHWSKLPVWCEGNVYFSGAKAWKKEKTCLVNPKEVSVEVMETPEGVRLKTNLYPLLQDFRCAMVSTQTLGRAFEPEQRFENPDGTPITFDRDYFGAHRGADILPGPFAVGEADGPDDLSDNGRWVWKSDRYL